MPLRMPVLDENGVFRQSHRFGRGIRREKIHGYVRAYANRHAGLERREKEKPRRFHLRNESQGASASRQATSA